MSIITSKYTVLSNKPVPKTNPAILASKIGFKLPFWFTNWKGQKIIKVYGCSFAYLETENWVPKLSTKYANQFISVHSNIVANDTDHLDSDYINEKNLTFHKPGESEIASFVDFMMVANNYYTPKIYDLTNSDIKNIVVWFRDAYGNLINLVDVFRGVGVEDEFHQAVFKIEIELAIGEQK